MKSHDRASMFLYQFRDFGEALGIPSETENGGDEAEDRAASDLEPDLDSAAQRATVWTDLQQRGAIISPGLNVQKVPRIDDCLRANRQTERRQILRHLNAERGIVNRQSAGKGIDRKHGRFGGEAKYRLHVRASGPVAGELHGYGLEEAAVENFRRIRDPVR